MTASKRVLSIDDRGDTLSHLIGALKRHGVSVIESRTVADAERVLSLQQFDFIIADARLQVDTELDMSAGPRLLARLREGKFGALNRLTPCLILTSYPYEVNRQEIVLEEYRGLLSKLSMSPEILGEMMDIDLSETDEAGPGERLQRKLLRIDTPYDPEDDLVHFSVETDVFGGESGPALIEVSFEDLPPDVRFRCRNSQRPLYVWATVNVAATRKEDLAPRSFDLYLGASLDEVERRWKGPSGER